MASLTSESGPLVEAYQDIACRLREQPNRAIGEVRLIYEGLHRVTAEPENVRYSEVSANGVPALWCRPNVAESQCALLYCHGGGFQLGSVALYRKLAGHLAEASGVPALLFEYRLAPEHPYPAQFADISTVHHWIVEQGVPPEKTIVIGDSAGGNLATGHVIRLRDRGDALPAGIVAFSPWFDLTLASPSVVELRHLDLAVSRSGLRAMREMYLSGGDEPDAAAVSPLFADLTGLPPMMLATGEHEILLDDTRRFAYRAVDAGVAVEVGVFPGMPHVFPLAAGRMREADDVIAHTGRWIRDQLGLS